jgi:hypothetical protein
MLAQRLQNNNASIEQVVSDSGAQNAIEENKEEK